jgi:site-specific recombinase XerD
VQGHFSNLLPERGTIAVLSLSYSSRDFRPEGYSRPGVPVFVNESNMGIVVLPSLWTVWLATVPGRARSARTWKAYATDLLMWLRACEVRAWDYRTPSEARIATFRDYLDGCRNVETGKREYTRRTVNRYVATVCRFYAWCTKHKHLDALPFEVETFTKRPRDDRSLLAHVNSRMPTTRSVLKLPDYDEDDGPPHYYSIAARQLLLAAMSVRDRVIARWALYTGLRIMEVAALALSQLPAQGSYKAGKYHPVRLLITKGDRPRTIWVPSFILDETWHYVTFERRRVFAAAVKRGGIGIDQNALWLNQWGRKLTDEGVRERFSTARMSAKISEGSFHSFRHTFAITMLHRLTKSLTGTANVEKRALLALKKLMGHRSLDSTVRYLEGDIVDITTLMVVDLEAADEIVAAA